VSGSAIGLEAFRAHRASGLKPAERLLGKKNKILFAGSGLPPSGIFTVEVKKIRKALLERTSVQECAAQGSKHCKVTCDF
jgi:hypothetical protein